MSVAFTTRAPLVSVIVPAFNVASVIHEALDSVRAQTFPDFEVVVNVDEGTTDDTAAVVRRFCEQDSRFVIVTQPHAGISAARNYALEHSRGELIAFLDADDVWLPEKLACQTAMFREDPRVNLSFTNFCTWDGRCDRPAFYRDDKSLPAEDVFRWLVRSNVFGTSTVVARRGLVQQAGLFDPAVEACEDWDLWLRMAENGLWVSGLRQPLVRKRCWSGGASNHKWRTAQYDVRVLEKNLRLSRHPEWRPFYERSLALARSRLELARARQLLDEQPEAVPAAIWRAWRLYPGHWQWLLRYGLAVWPRSLGGKATAGFVHRKLIQKW